MYLKDEIRNTHPKLENEKYTYSTLQSHTSSFVPRPSFVIDIKQRKTASPYRPNEGGASVFSMDSDFSWTRSTYDNN